MLFILETMILPSKFENILAEAIEIDHFSQGEVRGNYVSKSAVAIQLNDAYDSVVDSKGRAMPSVIATPITDEMAQQELAKTIRDEEAVLVSMLNDPSLSMAQVATELGWLSANTNMPQKSKVEKAIKALKEERLVKKSRKRWRLTDSGKKEAESINSSDKMGLFR